MAGLLMTDLVDLTRTTLEDLPKLQFETPQKYQEYVLLDRMLNRGFQLASGYQIKRNIQLSQSGNAEHVQLYQSTQVSVADVQTQLTAPWAHAQTYWSIERREALLNRSPARYVDLLESRRVDAQLALADIIEERGWKSIDSSSDTINPRGLPYWVTKGAASGDGFIGYQTYDNSGNAITSVGGITPASGDRWNNYYIDVNSIPNVMDSIVTKMHKIYRKIRFMAPRTVKDLDQGSLSNFHIYMDGDTIDAYTDYTRKSNDQIGFDVGKFAGHVAFQRTPVIWVPKLDDISSNIAGTNPIYFINHNKFKPFILRGDNFRESEPINDRQNHNVITVFVDLSYNFLCTDRRCQGLISESDL